MLAIVTRTTYKQLDKIGRPDIFLKLECDQFANSFKTRGIVNFLKDTDTSLKGLVTFTTGNHGIAVAAIADKLGIKAIIVSSQQLSKHKRTIIESYGATVLLTKFINLDQATKFAKQLAAEKDFTFVPLFGNDNLLDGYSEIAKEICEDFTGNLTMLFPVGSGSLVFANAKAAKEINPHNKIIAVEPKLFQRLNRVQSHNSSSMSIADCLAIDRIPTCNGELKTHIDGIATISEIEIVKAIQIIHEQFGIITEAGGAITLAAAMQTQSDNEKKIAVITGKNISLEKVNHFYKSYLNMQTISLNNGTHVNVTIRNANKIDTEKLMSLNQKWQKTSLGQNIKDGYVGAAFSKETFSKLITDKQVVLTEFENKLVGYYLLNNVSKDGIIGIHQDIINELKGNGKIANELKICVGAQAVVDIDFMGSGIRPLMLYKLVENIKSKYDYLFATIAEDNPRAFKAHTRDGWTIVDKERDLFYDLYKV